jgi:hypothetical protein
MLYNIFSLKKTVVSARIPAALISVLKICGCKNAKQNLQAKKYALSSIMITKFVSKKGSET